MKHPACLMALLLASSAHAYSGKELREDCQAAEAFFAQKKHTDPYDSVKSARCISYIAGFADGYAVGDYLSDKVGVKLNAFCLPAEGDMSFRLVRAVQAQLDRQPPNSSANTAATVAAALSNAFPCTETLERKK